VKSEESRGRSARRYSIEAPVVFEWSEQGQSKRGDGWLRDISKAGAFVCSAVCPPTGAQTKIGVVLPPLGKSGRMLRIDMTAQVMRVEFEEQKGDRKGFALASDHAALRISEARGQCEVIAKLDSKSWGDLGLFGDNEESSDLDCHSTGEEV
jgi:hypothetical protein